MAYDINASVLHVKANIARRNDHKFTEQDRIQERITQLDTYLTGGYFHDTVNNDYIHVVKVLDIVLILFIVLICRLQVELDATSGVKYRNKKKRPRKQITVSPVAWAIGMKDHVFIEEPQLLVDCRANKNGLLKELYPYEPFLFATQMFAGQLVVISRSVFESHYYSSISHVVSVECRKFTDVMLLDKMKMALFVQYVREHERFVETSYAYSFVNCIEMECDNGCHFYAALYNEFENKVYTLTVIRNIMIDVCGVMLSDVAMKGNKKNSVVIDVLLNEFIEFLSNWYLPSRLLAIP